MVNAKKNFSEIKREIKSTGSFVLMLDFDGVISPIVRTYDRAFISPASKQALLLLRGRRPVAIISGRRLSDVKRRVGVDGLLYVGNHGLQWEVGARRFGKTVPQEKVRAVAAAKRKLLPLLKRYPGMLLEDKKLALAIHYRIMPKKFVGDFKREVRKIIETIRAVAGLRIDHHKKTFELRAGHSFDKGHTVLEVQSYFENRRRKKLLPIYIGDSVTDEDAFRALPRGITIRVGKKQGSAAKYYFKSRSEVDDFLRHLVSLI